MNPFNLSADAIIAVVTWVFGYNFGDQIAAALSHIGTEVGQKAAIVAKWYRHNAAAWLRPLVPVWSIAQLALVGFANWWLVQNPVINTDDTWRLPMALAYLVPTVALFWAWWYIKGVKPINDWGDYFDRLSRIEELTALDENIGASLQLGTLEAPTKEHLGAELDRLNDAIEHLEAIQSRSADQERELDRLRKELEGIEELKDLIDQAELSKEHRLALRRYRQQIATQIDDLQKAHAEAEKAYGQPAGSVGKPFLIFILAPYFTGMMVLLATLFFRWNNGVAEIDLLLPFFVAIGLHMLGEAALKLTASVVGELLARLDTVFDQSLDAVIKPILAGALPGTTFGNISEKFSKVDLPLKEAGKFIETAPSGLVLYLRSILIWTLIFPSTWTIAAVTVSGFVVPMLSYKLTVPGLGDKAKSFVKKVAETEHKILYFGYAYLLVTIFWYMAARQYFPSIAFGNGAVDWVNRITHLGGWSIVIAMAVGASFAWGATFFQKAEGLTHRIYQVMNIAGAALIILPILGYGVRLGGVDVSLPYFRDPEPSRPAVVAEASTTESHTAPTPAYDTAREAAEHSGATTPPAPAVSPTPAPAAPPAAATGSAPHRPADATRATPRDTHRLERLDPELREIAEGMGFDT